MDDLVAKILSAIIALFLFASMFSLGLDLTLRQIIEPLRDRWLLARALFANVLLVPLLALLLTRIFPLDEAAGIGLLLYACCPGGEAAPKIAQIARGNTAFAIALLGTFLPISVIVVPLLLAELFPDNHVELGKLIFKLLLVVVLPVVLGLWIKATREPVAQRLSPVAHRVASVLMFVMLAGLIYTNFELLLAQEFVAIAAGVVFFPLAFVIGRLFGAPMPGNARSLSIMSAVRNGALSLLFATQVFVQTPAVLVMVTMMAVLSAAIMIPAGVLLARRPITAAATD